MFSLVHFRIFLGTEVGYHKTYVVKAVYSDFSHFIECMIYILTQKTRIRREHAHMLAERVKRIYSDVPSRIDHVSADAVPRFIVAERRSAPFLMTRVYAYYSVALATVDAAYY